MLTQTHLAAPWDSGTPRVTKCYRTKAGELVSIDKCEKIETAISSLIMLWGEDFTTRDQRKIRQAIAIIRSIQPDVEVSNDPF